MSKNRKDTTEEEEEVDLDELEVQQIAEEDARAIAAGEDPGSYVSEKDLDAFEADLERQEKIDDEREKKLEEANDFNDDSKNYDHETTVEDIEEILAPIRYISFFLNFFGLSSSSLKQGIP